MDAAVKGLLFLGVVLLVGAGVFARFVGPELAKRGGTRRFLFLGTLLGAGLVVGGSVLNVVITLVNVLGGFDPDFFWKYVQTTNHGRATLVRLVLVGVLLGLTWTTRLPRGLSHAVFLVTSLGLLLSFSFVSHNAAMGGTLPLLADLGHFVGACAWAGAVLYTAFIPRWHAATGRGELTAAVARVSSLGLTSVALLFATGIYASLLHIGQPSALVETVYGRVLAVKVALVLVVLAIAAANRWYFLPALRNNLPSRGFVRALRLEALLLIAVLGATGILTTSPMPH